jgi:hypothetical protein
VNVHGTRREIGQTTLSAADVREMPGAFGDPFRAIDALPGVVPLQSGIPYFYIRGAPPNDNGYYLDGIRVPLLFHVGLGEGVIHPALVDHVDFYPGAAPASYGGFVGATIAGQTREPATVWHGEANLRVIDAGALVEAPLDDGRFTVLAAGRYGYPGPILGAITSSLSLGYWDYQTRATWRVTEHDTLGVFAFGSHDYLASQSSGSGGTSNGGTSNGGTSNGAPTSSLKEVLVSDFHRLDLRWDHSFANGDGHMRVAATVGYDSQGAAPTYVTDYSAAARLEIEGKLSPTFRVRGRRVCAFRRLWLRARLRRSRARRRSVDGQPAAHERERGRPCRRRLAPLASRRDRARRSTRRLSIHAGHCAGRRDPGEHDRSCVRSSSLCAGDSRRLGRLALDVRHLASISGPAGGFGPAIRDLRAGFSIRRVGAADGRAGEPGG